MAQEKIDIDLDITPAAPEPETPKYKFTDPYWSNKDAKHVIVTIEYPNGKRATASVQDNDGENPDYKRIMEEFGEEVLDKNTEEGVKRRDDEIKKRLQRKETEAIRHKQEILFNSKIEAFEISTIKNSTNMELKRKIRKAKFTMEVAAYTTILLLDDFMNEKSVTDLWDETPSLVQKLKEVAEVVYDEKDKS